jgi:uncharacterized membrane protein YhaH (DUF805 family)
MGEDVVYWMTLPLRRYADFSGRSRRKEYWMFAIIHMLVLVLIGTAMLLSGAIQGGEGGAGPTNDLPLLLISLIFLVILVLLIPSLAVQVRRFHDQDRTGWHILLNFIPYIGSLIVLVLLCLPGTPGPNAYGPDPRDPYGTSDADPVIP